VARWSLLRGHRWRRSSSRVRFSEAVPLRSDRRDLRRQLRAALRTSRAERKRRTTAGLSALASRRVRIASVTPGELGDQLIEFADGTRLRLEVRHGTTALRRLAVRAACQDFYLGRIEPCFGCCWYKLGFSCAGESGPTVLAEVKQYESKTTWVQWAPSSRWHRKSREQRHG